MPARRTRRLTGVTLLLTATLITTACASTTAPEATPTATPTITTQPADTEPTPDPEGAGTVAPEDVTCENLIDADLVSDLTSRGWTPREDPFIIGDMELSDGLACTWGDFTAETGDNLLLFAWSPIRPEDAETARASLVSEGWLVEDGDDGAYVTEDPDEAIVVDDEGYGMTYLFGDGWVTLSDTKQGLVLIERPGL